MSIPASHPHHRPTPLLDSERAIRVLIAWNPSSTRADAIDFAAWLGRTARITVRVLSTFVEPWPAASLHKLGGKYGKWFTKEADRCRKTVAKALTEAEIPEDYWDDDYSVLIDGPSKPHLLTDAASDFGADVILLGPNQAAPKGRFLAGSTADALLHYSPVPLGLTPRKPKLSKHGVTRVNFAFTDNHGSSEDPALGSAAALADAWGVPLRIVAFSPSGFMDTPMNSKVDVSAEFAHQWREHSLALLDCARDNVVENFPELTVSTAIGSGSGWGGAIDSLKWKKGDLMVLGSSPLGPFARVFIGSTATELIPHMGVPVLVRPEENRKA